MSMTSYCSLAYLVFFLPPVVLIYSIIPRKFRWSVLLTASYIFFWIISGKLLIYLLISTMSIHHTGLWLSDIRRERDGILQTTPSSEKRAVRAAFQKRLRAVAAFGVAIQFAALAVLKYSPFFATNINSLFTALNIPLSVSIPNFIAPIGISFYTLQAMSYIFDVYRGTVRADRNPARLALYMAFFPQIMEGPICRYSETAEKLWSGEPVKYKNLTFGAQRILLGMIKKMVIADRLNLFIKTVFDGYAEYDGGIVALSAVLYTCQLYMEFSGTMDVVIGTGEIFGAALPENFRRPFFSRSISEFWKRWHITLGAWFKDYIFYPLSLSGPLRKLTSSARKKLGSHYGALLSGAAALFIVWLCNGLWHGAGWRYIFFGMYHFALILLGSATEPLSIQLARRLHIDRNSAPYRIFQIIRTSALVFIGELFFRANGLRAGFSMFKKILTDFTLDSFVNQTVFKLGMDKKDFLIAAICVSGVFLLGIANERGISIRTKLSEKNTFIRWSTYYAAVLILVIFGAYGVGYVPIDPIYAGF